MRRQQQFPKKRLEALLTEVCNNPHSHFYRTRLGHLAGRHLDADTWAAEVPLLHREDIQAVPFWDRVHVPAAEVPYIRNTYGTSGKRIMVTARTPFGDYSDVYGSARSVMNFFQSAHHEFPRRPVGNHVQTFFGDVGNLKASAAIMKAAGTEVLYTTPYTALAIAEYLAAYGAIEQVEVVQLCGERCSPLQFQTLKECYPNATVYSNFASSETRETVAVSCIHDREAGGSLVVEAADAVYCEIVHPETGELVHDEGVHGELVVTTLGTGLPFPLIRYATGDVAVYRARTCACEQHKRGFELVGRKSVFPVRLVRGELTVNAVEDALTTVPGLSSAYFEIHYREEASRGSALPRVHLVLLEPETGMHNEQNVARTIEEHLHVFPTYTYAQGVSDGIYMPLTVSFISQAPIGQPGKPKSPVIVRHMAGSPDEMLQDTVSRER